MSLSDLSQASYGAFESERLPASASTLSLVAQTDPARNVAEQAPHTLI